MSDTNPATKHNTENLKDERHEPRHKTQHRKLKDERHEPRHKTQHRKLKGWATRTPPQNTTQKTKRMSDTNPATKHNTEN